MTIEQGSSFVKRPSIELSLNKIKMKLMTQTAMYFFFKKKVENPFTKA